MANLLPTQKFMVLKFMQFINENEKTNYRVFCDMDGVLTNFDLAFSELNDEKLGPKEYEEVYGKNSIWPLISAEGSNFWSNLKWTSDGKSLWTYLKQYTPTILSSPSRDYSSVKGKIQWINNNLGISQSTPVTKSKNWDKDTRVILSQHKHLYVLQDQNSILIDDTPGKIQKWEAAGGIGILHKSTADTISQLERIIK
jgi:hypothetical protein